jgi:hypothetical protein
LKTIFQHAVPSPGDCHTGTAHPKTLDKTSKACESRYTKSLPYLCRMRTFAESRTKLSVKIFVKKKKPVLIGEPDPTYKHINIRSKYDFKSKIFEKLCK